MTKRGTYRGQLLSYCHLRPVRRVPRTSLLTEFALTDLLLTVPPFQQDEMSYTSE
jgi:hypothetical protein